MDFTVRKISYDEAVPWLLNVHYAKRIPSISYAFGLFDEINYMIGVCTFGTPASSPLLKGVCGEEFQEYVIELNRLVLAEHLPKNTASYFISRCFKGLSKPKIIVSYADTAQNHTGYVYQATNWIYTGLSAIRTDWKVEGLEHLHGATIADMSRGQENRSKYMRDTFGDKFYLQERPRKHRYIYFHGCSKKIKANLKYEIQPYPKGDNKRYHIDETKIVSVGTLF